MIKVNDPIALKVLAVITAKLKKYSAHPAWTGRNQDEPTEVDIFEPEVKSTEMDFITFAKGLGELEKHGYLVVTLAHDPVDIEVVETVNDEPLVKIETIETLLFQFIIPESVVQALLIA